MARFQTHSSQLLPTPRFDLLRRHVIHRRDRILDVALARAGVHDEHERVQLLDLLHRRLRRQRVLDDLEPTVSVIDNQWRMGQYKPDSQSVSEPHVRIQSH